MSEGSAIQIDMNGIINQLTQSFDLLANAVKGQIRIIPENIEKEGNDLATKLSAVYTEIAQEISANGWEQVAQTLEKANTLPDEIKQYSEKLNNRYNELKQAYEEGGLVKLTEKLLPEDTVQRLQESAQNINSYFEELKKSLDNGNLEDALEQLLPEDTYQKLSKLKEQFIEIKTKYDEVSQAFRDGDWDKVLKELAPDTYNQFEAVKVNFEKIKEQIAKIQQAGQEGNWDQVLQQLLPEDMYKRFTQLQQEFAKAQAEYNKFAAAFQEGGLEKVLEQYLPNDLFKQIFDFRNIQGDIQNVIGQVVNAFQSGGLGEALKVVFSQDWQSLFQGVQQKFEAWLGGLPDWLGKAVNILQSGLNGFFQSFSGTLSGIWSFIGNIFQGIGQTISGWISSLWTGILKIFSIPGRADGGAVNGNSMYLVGERGPELFVPGAGGTIIPNRSIGSNTGSPAVAAPSVTVNVINNSGQQVSARQESRFDGQRYVVDVWLDALARNVGGLRDVVTAGR